ncbi:hypothetical protein LCGC14_0347980 [marine sediment metagenome]|uniref:Uncharacterized protein n=1 Tax=marine sediment metagenome TaxID=412755 RepID=A0A0F9VZA3_9ZZZZ
MVDSPTKEKSLDEIRTNLAKSYVENSGGLVAVYNREEITFLLSILTRALEGSTFPGQQRIVNETRQLLSKWDWSKLPAELEGNLKLYVFNRLKLEKSKTYTFRRVEALIFADQNKEKGLNQENQGSSSLEQYAESQDEDSEVIDLQKADDEEFTYYVVRAEEFSRFELATILISMGNQSEEDLQVRLHEELLIVSDDPDLEDHQEESLAVYILDLEKDGGILDKKALDEQKD